MGRVRGNKEGDWCVGVWLAHCVGLPPAPTYSLVPHETGCCARKQAASTAACRNGDTPHSTVLRPKSIHTGLRLSPEVESVFQAELLPPQASAGYWSARPPPGTRRCPHRARTELPFERHSALLCSPPPLPSSLPAVSPPSQRYWARGLFVVGQI